MGGGGVRQERTRRREGEVRSEEAGEEREEGRERGWICDVQGTGGVGRALLHGAGAADRAGGAEAVRGFVAIRCGHRAQGVAGTGAGEVDDVIRERTFTCNMAGSGGRPCKRGMLDFLAVHLVQANLWYILPFAAASKKKSVSLQFTPEKAGTSMSRIWRRGILLRQ
jgi:hypothetical protein